MEKNQKKFQLSKSLKELKNGLLEGGFEAITVNHLLVAFGGDETKIAVAVISFQVVVQNCK